MKIENYPNVSGIKVILVIKIVVNGQEFEWDKDTALAIARGIMAAFGDSTRPILVKPQSPLHPNPLTGKPYIIGSVPMATYKDPQSYVDTGVAS